MKKITVFLLLGFIGSMVAKATTINWTNTAGGNWTAAANWNPHQVPDSTDDAVITNNGTYTVTLDSSSTLKSLTLGGSTGQQTLTTSGNTLTLTNASVINTNGIFGLSGGALTAAGLLKVNGQFVWNNGSITAGSVLTIATNGLLTLTGGSTHDFYGSLTNAGTIRLSTGGGDMRLIGSCGGGLGRLVNLPGALLDVQDDYSIYNLCGDEQILNQGTVRKSGGTNTTAIYPTFTNSGTLDVQTGTVSLNNSGSGSGLFLPAAGATLLFPQDYEVDSALTGAGTNRLTGGTFTLKGNITGANVFLAGANLLASNAVINSALTWNNGSITASSVLTIATNGLLTLTGGSTHDFYGSLTNAGTIRLSTGGGDMRLIGSCGGGLGRLVNLPGALLDVQDDYSIYNLCGDEQILNQGTVRKSGGTNTTAIYPTFTNSGTLDVQTGTVSLNNSGSGSGLFLPAAGATLLFPQDYEVDSALTGAGTNRLTGGTFTLKGNITGANVFLAGANLLASNAVINSALTWNNGSITAGSVLTIATNGLLTLTGGSTHDFYGSLTNAGTIRLSTGGGDMRLIGICGGGLGRLVNLPGALLDVQDDYSIYNLCGDEQILNQGTVRKSGGTNTTAIYPTFTNSGTLDVQTGTVSLNNSGSGSGLFLPAAGATLLFPQDYEVDSALTGAGTNRLTGGTFTLKGNITGANVFLAGANLLASNAVINSALTWNNGSITASSVLTIATNGLLTLTGGSTHDFYGSLTNAGTIRLSTGGGDMRLIGSCGGGLGRLVNLPGALLDVQDDYSIYNLCGDEQILNQGTVRKSGGTNTTAIYPTFTNSGTLDVQSGNVSLQSSYDLTGGRLNIGINSRTNYGSITLSGTAPLAGTISANLNNGFQPIGGNSFTNIFYSAFSGLFTNTVLPFANAWSTNYFPNYFVLSVLNARPVFAAPATNLFAVNELTTLTVTNKATDADLPAQTLVYSLAGGPNGIAVNSATGLLAWTPQQTNSPSTNVISVAVTDNGTPALSATNTFTVIVKEVNLPASLPTISTQTVNELTLLTVTNTATNANIHSTITGYTLVSPPSGMNINASGVITWTPSQTQSPSTNTITTIVTNSNPYDLINPSLKSTNTFTVIVKEVNVAPSLSTIATQTVNELTLLTVTNTATNANIHSTITGYTLVTPSSGMVISSSGIITWTPAQVQSPSTNLITTIVTNSDPFDLINPILTATNTFTVIVREVNIAPVLSNIFTQTVTVNNLLTVTNTAVETNIHATLGYTLTTFPTGMTINSNGIITWTPNQTQSPSTNQVTTVVTNTDPFDLINPHLSATNTFHVVVSEFNIPPAFDSIIATQTVNELTLLSVTNAATNANIHATILGYGLINPPAGAGINTNGVFTWTPQQTNSPSTNLITTVVTNTDPYDLVNPQLISTNTFTVIVREVNVAPSLPTVPTQIVNELTLLTVTNAATNANIHSTITGYTLVTPPSGMSINPSGIITWTPSQAQSPSTNSITTIATNSNPYDLINPQIKSTNTFTVIVQRVNPGTNAPALLSIVSTNIGGIKGFWLSWQAPTNQQFLVRWSSKLTPTQWRFFTNIVAYGGILSSTNGWFGFFDDGSQTSGFGVSRIYQLLLAESASTNFPPVLPVISDQIINSQDSLNLITTATTADIYAVLDYTLINPPLGMNIDLNGVITWKLGKPQLPGTNLITVIVTSTDFLDPLHPRLSVTNSFNVTVIELNVAPVLPNISTQYVNESALLTVVNTATELNSHVSSSGYTLINPPAGMSISADGIINWTPSHNQSPGIYTIITVATNTDLLDLINPHLSSTNSFTVYVYAQSQIDLWHFNEGSGTTAVDSVGSNPGSLVNSPQWVSGIASNALHFNGVNQYVMVNPNAILGLANNFTIEAWVKWDGGGTDVSQMIYCEGRFNDMIDLYLSSGVPSFTVNCNPWITLSTASPLSIGAWHHLAAVLQSGVGGTIYVDGQPLATNPNIGPVNFQQFNDYGNGESDIGCFVGNGRSRYFNGTIDEVQLFNTAKSPQQILADYRQFGSYGPPVITSQPLYQTVASGTTATFTLAAKGATPLNYSWQLNGTNIAGATKATLTITNVSPANLGVYTAVVNNPAGNLTSVGAVLTILDTKQVVSLVLNGIPGTNYSLQAAAVLDHSATNWVTLTNLNLMSSPFTYVDFSSWTNRRRFYRYQTFAGGDVFPLNLQLLNSAIITGPIGLNYSLQSTAASGNGDNWITLTNLVLTTPPYIYVDYTSATNISQIYRAVPQ